MKKIYFFVILIYFLLFLMSCNKIIDIKNKKIEIVQNGFNIIKMKITGNYEINITIKNFCNEVTVFFSADKKLSKLAYLKITPKGFSIGRKVLQRMNAWKEHETTIKFPLKIRVLKKGNFFRFWINDTTEWISSPMGVWSHPKYFEPHEAWIGLKVAENVKISTFKVITLPWLDLITKPIISKGPPGSFYEEQVIPGAIIKYKQKYYMYFMAGMRGNEEGASKRTIGVATSEDLVNWTVYPSPVIDSTNFPFDNLYPNGAVITPEGKIAVMFSAQKFPEWTGFGLALSDNPLGPFKHFPSNPVYRHFSHAHEFDLVRVDQPKYRYILFYAGFTPNPPYGPAGDRGYLLYSNDLVHWKEDPRNPVFGPQTLDNWDAIHVRPRSLTKIGNYWYLWYEGCNHWIPPDNPEHHGWWDTVGLARSKDLIHWEYYERNPALPGMGISTEQFDNTWIGWPRMIIERGIGYIFYTGNGIAGLRTIEIKELTDWSNNEGGKIIDMLK